MKTDGSEEMRIRILDEAARLFDKKGIKFTMDDLARSLGMSKKTIYTVFEDKRSIMTETIDRFFDDALM
ncbi:MAG: helix-turn-helix transcriptional regulator, partial [Mogibacterium sp.]|nr:helix-turn-helix transcriptional regulator [Mogibacterium sp.]